MSVNSQACVERLVKEYRGRKKALKFFDSNLWVATPVQPGGFCLHWGLDALLGYMDRYAIEEGIVAHNAAVKEDTYKANAELLSQIEGSKRLWGGLVLNTELPRGYSNWGDYLDWALSKKTRLVRIFPKSHKFSLERWCSGAMLDAVSERRIPLVIWHVETAWEHVHKLCETYPEMPIIIEGWPEKLLYHLRYFYPLMEQCKNFYIGTHNVTMYLGIEDMVARFGAQQLIFGSCMPFVDPNNSQMMVTHARIDENAKQRIAHGNLKDLLERIRTK
jgi:hypothetical protein